MPAMQPQNTKTPDARAWWRMSHKTYVALVCAGIALNLAALALSYLPGFYDAALTTIYVTMLAAPFVIISRYFGLGYPARWLIVPVALLLLGLFVLVGTLVVTITGGGGSTPSMGEKTAFAGLLLSLTCFAVIATLGLFPYRMVGTQALVKHLPFSQPNEVPK